MSAKSSVELHFSQKFTVLLYKCLQDEKESLCQIAKNLDGYIVKLIIGERFGGTQMGNQQGIGTVKISNDVLAKITGFAALECYGIAGMASPGLQAGVAQLLTRDKLQKGVKVKSQNNQVEVDLYVIVEFEINMAEVANNLMSKIKYVLEKSTGVEVKRVDVHVQGVKLRRS